MVLEIGDKSRLTDEDEDRLAAIVQDDIGVAQAVLKVKFKKYFVGRYLWYS